MFSRRQILKHLIALAEKASRTINEYIACTNVPLACYDRIHWSTKAIFDVYDVYNDVGLVPINNHGAIPEWHEHFDAMLEFQNQTFEAEFNARPLWMNSPPLQSYTPVKYLVDLIIALAYRIQDCSELPKELISLTLTFLIPSPQTVIKMRRPRELGICAPCDRLMPSDVRKMFRSIRVYAPEQVSQVDSQNADVAWMGWPLYLASTDCGTVPMVRPSVAQAELSLTVMILYANGFIGHSVSGRSKGRRLYMDEWERTHQPPPPPLGPPPLTRR